MAKLLRLRTTLTAGLVAAVALTLHGPTASAAPIAVGDAIAVDFSSTGGSATNFNVFTSNSTKAAGTVIRHSDGAVVDGVSLTVAGATAFNDNNSNAEGWSGEIGVGAPPDDPYYVQAANDLAYETGAGAISLTFAGLDDSLTYNVRIYSLLNQDTGRTMNFSVTNGAGFETLLNSSRADRWNAATLEAGGTVFSGVSVNASNEIVVTYTDGNNAVGFMNAVVLEVVPEPASLALMGLGGLMMLPRRRR